MASMPPTLSPVPPDTVFTLWNIWSCYPNLRFNIKSLYHLSFNDNLYANNRYFKDKSPRLQYDKTFFVVSIMSLTKLLLLMWAIIGFCPVVQAAVFLNQQQALQQAFGDHEIETLRLSISSDQQEQIEQLARVKLNRSAYLFYVGKNETDILGYAAIENFIVRNQPATLLILLTPQGQIQSIQTLAFHEKPHYQPPQRWYEQFYNRPLNTLNHEAIQGITGATLSSQSYLNAARKAMAVFKVMIQEKN